MIDVKDALTHKYGPLPGYAWAALGAGAIVLVASRKSGGASSSSPAFLTTPPTGAIGGDVGAGGGGGADPATSTGLPAVVDPGALVESHPGDMPYAGAATAADYFAENPLPQGTTTQQALDALGAFPAQSYAFGPSPYVDYSSIPSTPEGWAALTGAASPQNGAAPVAAAIATPTPTTPPAGDTSMLNIHYLHGRDPEQ